MQLDGTLFTWSEHAHVAFVSHASAAQAVVLLNGIGDGFCALPYTPLLTQEMAALGWAVAQVELSSFRGGFGTSTLAQDATELVAFLGVLRRERGVQRVVLLGHSTGCQQSVAVMRALAAGKGAGEGELPRVVGVVLQGAVSDRECLAMEGGGVHALAARVRAAVRGGAADTLVRGDEWPWGVPITAYRLDSLLGRGGGDDMFSSDLTPAELAARLAPLAESDARVLWLHSWGEEYVPPHVDQRALAARLAAAVPGSAVDGFGPPAPHSLAGHEQALCTRVAAFVRECGSA